MAASQAIIGKGSSLQVKVSGSFVPIIEIMSATLSGSKTDQVDVSNFDSPSGFREFRPTLSDPVDCSFTGNWIPSDASQQDLQTLFNNQTVTDVQIVLPDSGPTLSFSGFVSGFDRTIKFDEAITLSGKIKITGPITQA